MLIILSSSIISYLISSYPFVPYIKSSYAQVPIENIKTRNLVIDLGNGIKTNAQLTLPASSSSSLNNGRPYPGVLLVHLGGPQDMNETNGIIVKGEPKTIKQFWQIAQYLSERGFAVLRFDKRGIGANNTVIDNNVWGNTTFNDLKQDVQKALAVLMQQPEVDIHKISILGHSEGSHIAPRIAIDYPDKIRNIILMSASSQNESESTYHNILSILQYAKTVVDKNKDGLISLQEASRSPMKEMMISNDTNSPVFYSPLKPKYDPNNNNSYVSIDNGLKPFLMDIIKPPTTVSGRCDNPNDCPIMKKSSLALPSLLSIINKIPSNINILFLEGENDAPDQVLALNQRLTEIKHPDHAFIIYPGLGHLFYPSPKLFPQVGPLPEYVLHDIFSWLLNHTK